MRMIFRGWESETGQSQESLVQQTAITEIREIIILRKAGNVN